MPYVHVSNALHFDCSVYTPLPVYDWRTRPARKLGLLKRASVCITHAGLNTVLEALAQGVPQVSIPVTNDQLGVGPRIAAKKTGLVAPLKELTAPRLSRLVDEVLTDPLFRNNSRHLKKIIAETNGLSLAADILERAFGLPYTHL
jgi:UDP:flavonoid glycosyltransferase YjiC (YdhE family)